jgi:hypothetical protein
MISFKQEQLAVSDPTLGRFFFDVLSPCLLLARLLAFVSNSFESIGSVAGKTG